MQLSIPERIVESVITHQYQSASNALTNNHSVEIAGFGKLLLNKKKAEKKHTDLIRHIERLEYQLEHPESTTRKVSWIEGILKEARSQKESLKKLLKYEN